MEINPDVGFWKDIASFQIELQKGLEEVEIVLDDFIVKGDMIYGACSQGRREYSFGLRIKNDAVKSAVVNSVIQNMLQAFNSPDNIAGEIKPYESI